MRISQLYPIAVQTLRRGLDNCEDRMTKCIVVGKSNINNSYISELKFPPIVLNEDEMVQQAVLKLFCKRVCGSNETLKICINWDDNNCTCVDYIGAYEWDVTNIIQSNNKVHMTLCADTNCSLDRCGLKEFEVYDYNTKPLLELVIVKKNSTGHIFENCINEYWASSCYQNTSWIDTSCFNDYYFFIENLGESAVEIVQEISPGPNMIFQDVGPTELQSHQTGYFVPLRVSQFVRISFKSIGEGHINLIKVWFQGKK